MLYWLPVLFWAGLLFYLSSLSHPKVPEFRYSDKVCHLAFYSVFGLLFVRAFRPIQKKWGWMRVVLAGLLGGILYGLTDEFHQMFVSNRTAEVMDLVMDGLGGMGGGIVWSLASLKKR